MILVDTNILVDIRERDPLWQDWSLGAVADARLAGPVATSVVTVGELASRQGSLEELMAFTAALGMDALSLNAAAAHRAGAAQRAYRLAGGKREKLLADFLIGAAAEGAGAALLTRDPRPYRTYFPELTLITPETENG